MISGSDFLASCALVCVASSTASAQTYQAGSPIDQRSATRPTDPAVVFLSPFGIENFSEHYVDALSALLRAQAAYDADSFVAAENILDELWMAYPAGTGAWASLPSQPFGINLGTPPAYYGLRMLTDTVAWRAAHPASGPALRTARLTVLLAGHSSGIEPTNAFELVQGTGVPVQHSLDELLLADDSAILYESLHLFREYVVAMTEGALDVEVNVLHLPDADLAVHASWNGGSYFAGLSDAGEVWPLVPAEELEATDWWWLIYPSHVPEAYPAFTNSEFITGGMGTGADSQSPLFLIDDRWLTRKPPHLGTGPYTSVERSVYLPQWLQHEFFHHLFRTYPELGLESASHQWFDLGTWPPDFEGLYEADYSHEALTKRLIDAEPPLVSALRYATAGAPWNALNLPDVLGDYERHPIENGWHLGSIQFDPQLEWQNSVGVDWSLQDDLSNGRLLTAPDCPYYGTWNGNKFSIVLERDELGDLLPEIAGFAFNGEIYERVGP